MRAASEAGAEVAGGSKWGGVRPEGSCRGVGLDISSRKGAGGEQAGGISFSTQPTRLARGGDFTCSTSGGGDGPGARAGTKGGGVSGGVLVNTLVTRLAVVAQPLVVVMAVRSLLHQRWHCQRLLLWAGWWGMWVRKSRISF